MDPITLAALADFPHRLEAYYSVVPNEYKNWRPASWDGTKEIWLSEKLPWVAVNANLEHHSMTLRRHDHGGL
jgi:hypothetical protein